MAQKNSRKIALDIFKQCHGETPLPELLEQAFSQNSLDLRDKRLCTELVYGTLRHLGRLKFALEDYVKKPESLPPQCWNILLLASYEILFLNIPSHATVNEYADMAKKLFGKKLAGLCNAVLRSLERNKEEILLTDTNIIKSLESAPYNKKMGAISGLAPWFLKSILQENRNDVRKVIAQILEAPVPSYRVNSIHSINTSNDISDTPDTHNSNDTPDNKLTATKIHSLFPSVVFSEEENIFLENCILEGLGIISPESNSILQGMEEKGLLTRQGLASQELIGILVNVLLERGSPDLWDACCGRGGKSCGLLERGINVVCASDPNAQRLEHFAQALERLGLREPSITPNILTISRISSTSNISGSPSLFGQTKPFLVQGTVQELCSNPEKFNAISDLTSDLPNNLTDKRIGKIIAILLDAPCTGSGTLGRNPELYLRITEEKLARSIALQKDILEHAWQVLPHNGLLIYATCSVFPEENTIQIADFSQSHVDVEIIQESYIIPKYTGHDILYYAILQKN